MLADDQPLQQIALTAGVLPVAAPVLLKLLTDHLEQRLIDQRRNRYANPLTWGHIVNPVGSAGLLSPALKVRSVVAGMSAYSNSNYGAQFGFRGNMAPCCSFELLEKAVAAARKMGVEMPVGPIYSTDVFYDETKPSPAQVLQGLGVLAVEMEAYALYLNAARAGKNALALLTISDNPFTGESLTPQEVRETFTQMMEIALEIA